MQGDGTPARGPGIARVVSVAVATIALLAVTLLAWPRPEPALAKITFDLSNIGDDGLYGPPDGRVARGYEFCIPGEEAVEAEVRAIDPTLEISSSPGRVGCTGDELLAIGHTHQADWFEVLARVARLPYVERIEAHLAE